MEDNTKLIPIFSGLLIFIGYFNLHSFYMCFDIEIWSYLTTGELLLSFFQLIIPILTIIALFFLNSIVVLFKKRPRADYNKTNWVTVYLFKETLVTIIESFKKKEYKKWNVLWLLPEIILLLIGAALIIFFGAYVFILIKMLSSSSSLLVPTFIMIIYSIFWVFLLIDIAERADKSNSLRSPKTIKLIFISLIFLALIWVSNKEKAFSINNGNPIYDVSFTTNMNKTVCSGSNLVYIGKTSNYLFLRNLNDKRNIIYSLNNIEKIDIKKHIN